MSTRAVIVGMISDTHGLLRPEVLDVFARVDLIIHAGDVGGQQVLDALAKLAPVEAVSGNVDDRDDPALVRERSFPVGAMSVHVSHGDELGRPRPEQLLARYAGDIVIYGHTHKPTLFRDGTGRIAVNPGSAGPRRFGLEPTVARMTVVNRQAEIEFITLT